MIYIETRNGMKFYRYNNTKFIDNDGNEEFLYDEKPSFAWSSLGDIPDGLFKAYQTAWVCYRICCPSGICEPETVEGYMRSMHGLSVEAAKFVAYMVYPIRNSSNDGFKEWLLEHSDDDSLYLRRS